MLNFLFRRLTAEPPGDAGAALFAALTEAARQPHWYVNGQVPDTIDGRFAILATLTALALVRLEQLGEAGNALSVALTERFIAVIECEHRELGLGDPALGRKVRKLVGVLARRVDLWRGTIGGGDWVEAARESVYKDDAGAASLRHSCDALKARWQGLERSAVEALREGRID